MSTITTKDGTQICNKECGIGAAIVKRLASEGAHVSLTYTGKTDQAVTAMKVAQALGVKAMAIQADSADAEALVAAVERTVRELGGIDTLVNNAGITVIAPIDDYRLEDLDRTLAVNVRAVFIATQAAAKHLQAGGRIITIGSCNAEGIPFTGGGVYGLSKAALVGLVKGLARDLAPRGITINNVRPGPVETDLNPATTDFAKMLVQQHWGENNGGKICRTCKPVVTHDESGTSPPVRWV